MTILLALAASLTWGTSDFVAGRASGRIPARTVVTCSQIVALLVVTLVVLLVGLPFPSGAWWLWGALAGVVEGLGLLALYTALARGPMGVVTPIAGLGVIVPVAVGVARGDPITALLGVGLTVAITGAVLASGPQLTHRRKAGQRAIGLAVTAALGLGAAMVFVDLGSRISGVHTLWTMRVASVLLFLGLAAVTGSGTSVARRHLPTLVTIGVADLSATALFSIATSRGQISIASVLASLYPVTTIILARWVANERLRPVQVVGVLAALCGIALIAL